MLGINAKRLVDLVERKVRDQSNDVWTPAQILEYADEALEDLYTDYIIAGNEDILNSGTWTPANFTNIGQDVWQVTPGEQVGHIRKLEAMDQGSVATPIPIDWAELEDRSVARGPFSDGTLKAYRSGPNTIDFLGNINNFASIQYWYYRRWPPLHYGTADAASNAATCVFAAIPTVGPAIPRHDVYVDMEIELTDRSFISRVTAYDGPPRTCTMSGTWTDPSGLEYALVAPLLPQFASLLVNKTALALLEDEGSDTDIILRNPRFQHLYDRWRSGITQRDNVRPLRLVSRRARRGL